MERHFRILGVGATLAAPPRLVDPIAFAYRRFALPAAGGPPWTRIEAGPGDRAVVSVDGRPLPPMAGLDPLAELYRRFLDALMDRIDSHAVLHAAALVERSGRALLLAAPSGHGKSSLTLELLRRGLGFMGDDYAPLDLSRRSISPYPRAVSVLPLGDAPIPSVFRERVVRAVPVRMFGKCLLDVGDVLGENALATGPAPLGHVFCLTSRERSGDEAEGRTWIELAAGDGIEELERRLAGTAGVEIVERLDRPPLRRWRLRLDHASGPTRALEDVLRSDRVVVLAKAWEARPDFRSPPRAEPMSRREAAELLGREVLNRRPGGDLLKRRGGNVATLFLELAGALRDASCWRVSVGPCEATADLIEQLCREAPRSDA